MSQRLVEMVLDQSLVDWAQEPMDGVAIQGMWTAPLGGGQCLVRFLLRAEDSEKLLEVLQHRYRELEEFRCVVLPVEASLPLPKAREPIETKGDYSAQRLAGRMSREELYEDVQTQAMLTPTFAALCGLSALVAAIGLMRGNLAVIIGAMVIAPLLGPNMALSLATCLGEKRLFVRALLSLAVGLALSLALTWALGLAVPPPLDAPEIAARTHVSLGDVALALASGAAGALAFTTGLSAALVGVMVAVALVPPLAAVGLLLAAGQWVQAGAAALLFAVNLACINLAGVTTFLAQGLRPPDKDDAKGARRAAGLLAAFWLALLAVLVWVILHLEVLKPAV